MSIETIPDESANRPKNKGEAEGTGVPISPWEEADQAKGELRWLFCQSAGELGEHSAWNALVQMAQVGGHQGTRLEPYVDGEVTAPMPSASQIWAAKRQAKYRAALRTLAEFDQALLERQLGNGRPNHQVKGLLEQHKAAELEPTVTYMLRRGDIRIKTDGTDKELPGIIDLARSRYEAALDGYRKARGLRPKAGEFGASEMPPAPSAVPVETGVRRRSMPVEAPRKAKP